MGLRLLARLALKVGFVFISVIIGLSQTASSGQGGDRGMHVTYVYRNGVSDRDAFVAMLTDAGYTTSTVHIDDVATWSFDQSDLIIIGADTDNSAPWGTPDAIANLSGSGLPVIGINQGGSIFFEDVNLFIGSHQTMGVSGNHGIVVENSYHDIWHFPDQIPIPPDSMIELYPSGSYAIIVYIDSGMPSDVTCVGRPWYQSAHCGLTLEDWDGRLAALWSWEGSPTVMTEDAKTLFLNLVASPSILFADGFESGTTYYWD